MNRANFLLVVAAFVLPFCAGTAQAQAVRMLSGYAPGGGVDVLARIYSEKLAEAIRRPVVVETRTGAAGQIAATALKASAPDGNSLLIIPSSGLTLYPYTEKTPVYDPLKDFVPVAHVGSYESGLLVGSSVSANDLGAWVSWAKADKKNAIVGTPGAGTGPHFLGVMLAQVSGVPLVHAHYRGVTPALADLLGGHIQAAMIPMFAEPVQQAKAGKIRFLAHSGGRRSPVLPEVPTFKELGYPALEVSGWYCIVAPAGIRPEVVARYNEIIIQAQRTASVRDRMRALDLEIREMAPAEIAAMIKAEYDRWGPIVKASGFSADSQ